MKLDTDTDGNVTIVNDGTDRCRAFIRAVRELRLLEEGAQTDARCGDELREVHAALDATYAHARAVAGATVAEADGHGVGFWTAPIGTQVIP